VLGGGPPRHVVPALGNESKHRCQKGQL
jgi:hypothetical protein